MARALNLVFGDGRNAVVETVEVFRQNAEAEARRVSTDKSAALAQFAAEFARPPAGLFDRVIDGLNRLPRPAMALGCIGLFAAAMADPAWFGMRMGGLAQVPEPLWWLMGAIVSFYFGARHQAKGQDFQRALAGALIPPPAPAPAPDTGPGPVATAEPLPGPVAEAPKGAVALTDNAALADWQAGR